MTNWRGRGPAYLSDEIRYWDEIYRHGGGSSAEHYRKDAFGANVWGLYRYGRYFRDLRKDARIVEIGAGAVSKALYLAKFAGFSCTYVTDVSIAGLVANREVARQLGVADRGGYVVTDAEDLALRDDSCDVVFCHSSLHHVSDPRRAIASMARCLRPGGLLIIGHEPNLRTYGRLRQLADRLRLTERHTAEVFSVADAEVHGFHKDDLLAWMRGAGVKVVAVDAVWFIQGLVFLLREMVRRVTGAQLRVSGRFQRATEQADLAIGSLPGLSELPLFWTVIGIKPGR